MRSRGKGGGGLKGERKINEVMVRHGERDGWLDVEVTQDNEWCAVFGKAAEEGIHLIEEVSEGGQVDGRSLQCRA